ncbi:MAG: hypothetical protein BWY83_01974 [bacterium ADurb.Bin478]|nr:MAG: hypothetical protein BWY83_01974 [bacterium ADurb.Bin478]
MHLVGRGQQARRQGRPVGGILVLQNGQGIDLIQHQKIHRTVLIVIGCGELPGFARRRKSVLHREHPSVIVEKHKGVLFAAQRGQVQISVSVHIAAFNPIGGGRGGKKRRPGEGQLPGVGPFAQADADLTGIDIRRNQIQLSIAVHIRRQRVFQIAADAGYHGRRVGKIEEIARMQKIAEGQAGGGPRDAEVHPSIFIQVRRQRILSLEHAIKTVGRSIPVAQAAPAIVQVDQEREQTHIGGDAAIDHDIEKAIAVQIADGRRTRLDQRRGQNIGLHRTETSGRIQRTDGERIGFAMQRDHIRHMVAVQIRRIEWAHSRRDLHFGKRLEPAAGDTRELDQVLSSLNTSHCDLCDAVGIKITRDQTRVFHSGDQMKGLKIESACGRTRHELPGIAVAQTLTMETGEAIGQHHRDLIAGQKTGLRSEQQRLLERIIAHLAGNPAGLPAVHRQSARLSRRAVQRSAENSADHAAGIRLDRVRFRRDRDNA